MRFRLRSIMPKGLFARSLLIIVLPVALMQGAVTWAFFRTALAVHHSAPVGKYRRRRGDDRGDACALQR